MTRGEHLRSKLAKAREEHAAAVAGGGADDAAAWKVAAYTALLAKHEAEVTGGEEAPLRE